MAGGWFTYSVERVAAGVDGNETVRELEAELEAVTMKTRRLAAVVPFVRDGKTDGLILVWETETGIP